VCPCEKTQFVDEIKAIKAVIFLQVGIKYDFTILCSLSMLGSQESKDNGGFSTDIIGERIPE